MEKIRIDLNSKHPFNEFGATNGPRPIKRANRGEQIYKELDFTYSRLHDTGIISFHRYVDIDKIFKNFDKDENDLNNYFFKDTDRYIDKLCSLNTHIIFRLGYSAVLGKNYKNSVPASIDKWAKIACNIAKHYEGKVEYFEIWNEPDLQIFFDGSLPQLCEIYQKTAALIKKNVKDAKVGGCAFAMATGDMAQGFLKFVKENDLPLDFYSYHRYHFQPEEFRKVGIDVRKMLDDFGFENCITILDEWNFNINFNHQLNESYRVMPTNQGAIFVLSSLMEIAKAPIDINTYYDFEINYMLFIYNGIVRLTPWFGLKTTETFRLYKVFNILKNTGYFYDTNSSVSGLYALAAKSDDALYVLMTNYRFIDNRDFEVEIEIGDFEYRNVEIIGKNRHEIKDCLTSVELENESYRLIKYNF